MNDTPNAEEWRQIDGYEGRYDVSDLGNIRSWVGGRGRGRKWKRLGAPHLLKPFGPKDGHLSVDLSYEGVGETKLVHQLVLFAFVGPRPGGASWVSQ